MYHPVLSFMVGLIIELVQIKCQGTQAATATDDTSPFSTHPVTMLLALLWLFLYFFAALAASATANSSAAAASSASSSPSAEIVAATSSTWSLWMSSLLGTKQGERHVSSSVVWSYGKQSTCKCAQHSACSAFVLGRTSIAQRRPMRWKLEQKGLVLQN